MDKENNTKCSFVCKKEYGNFNLVVSFTENLASDTDQGASFLDGQWIIVGHSHGYFLE